MLIERHNTHVLSYNSSSNNHSYDSEIMNKKMNNINRKEEKEKEKSVHSELTKVQISKINDILNKYNLISSDRNEKKDELNNYVNKKLDNDDIIGKSVPKPKKSIFSMNSETPSRQRKKKKKNPLKKNVIVNDSKQISNNNSILNINNNTNISKITHNINVKEKSEENTNLKKNDKIFNDRFLQYPETKLDNNKKKDLIYAISFKKSNRETRFNNIQKYINEENKIQQKSKNYDKNRKFLMYQQMISSRNLLRSICKPKISFITKEYKNFGKYYSGYDMFSGVRLNVKSNFCFFTKKIIRQDEYIVIEKQLKLQKYEKLKKEVEEEKIPTFSSIDSSSSNSIGKVKAKGKGKSKTKSKTKKKINIYKTKIKPKNLAKKGKKTLLQKYNKIRSVSMHSKISNDKSEDRKTVSSRMNYYNYQKIPNMKKKTRSNQKDHKKSNGGIKDKRKLSVLSRFHDRFVNKNKNIDKNKLASSTSLRNIQNFKSPFKNSLININKQNEEEKNKLNISGNKDKDKANNELDFKKFLEEQKIKRSIQIRNFIKQQGMTSYNFFYPKEPSPLLGIFKNKYSVYPTLNMNRRSSLDEEEKRFQRLKNEMNYSPINETIKKGNRSYRREKIFLRGIKENKNEEIHKIHLIEKHYGTEKDCPICRAFKLKDEENEMNYMKSARCNKLKFHKKRKAMFSPNSRASVHKKNDFPLMSRNRIDSAKKSDIINENQSSQINQNYNVLFDYFMQ